MRACTRGALKRAPGARARGGALRKVSLRLRAAIAPAAALIGSSVVEPDALVPRASARSWRSAPAPGQL